MRAARLFGRSRSTVCRNPARSNARIARVFSASGSATTRVASGSAFQLPGRHRAEQAHRQATPAAFGRPQQHVQSGVMLTGDIVLGERVEVGAVELPVAHRDAIAVRPDTPRSARCGPVAAGRPRFLREATTSSRSAPPPGRSSRSAARARSSSGPTRRSEKSPEKASWSSAARHCRRSSSFTGEPPTQRPAWSAVSASGKGRPARCCDSPNSPPT